jgi:phosphoglycolate phosphatase
LLQPRLILFDIDCTLLRTGGAGMAALTRALVGALGHSLNEEESPVRPDGQTDPNIIRQMLQHQGIPPGRWPELEREVLALYPEIFEEELRLRWEQSRLEPGISALLDRLEADPRCRLGVLTGNIEVTARMKLGAFELNRFFPIGAFGSDCADRNRLGPVALERARRHFQIDFVPAHAWIVGDTDRDIRAARAGGLRALAVATGHYSRAELEEHCPDLALDDLTNAEQVIGHLLA